MGASGAALTQERGQNRRPPLEGRGTAPAGPPPPPPAPCSWAQPGGGGCSGDGCAWWTPCPPSPLWQGQGNPPAGVQRDRSGLERRSAASAGSRPETGSRASSGRGTGARPGWPAGPPHTGGRRRAEGCGGRSRLAGRRSPLAPPPGDAEGADRGEIRACEGALGERRSPGDWWRSGSELLTGSEPPLCPTVISANRLRVSCI